MLRGRTPSSKLFGRIGLFFIISAMFLTITAAGANAAGFSFMDSVMGFLGFAPTQTAALKTETAEPISAPAFDTEQVLAATSTQNFGTGTGSHTSATGTAAFIPNPTSGTTWARGGATVPNGPINLVTASNPLGTTGAYVRGVASTSTSVSKFSPWVGYTPAPEFYTSFKVMFGDSTGGSTATSGVWSFYQGAGAMYSDNSGFSGAQLMTGLNWAFGAGGAISLTYRSGAANVTTGLTQTAFSSATVYTVEVVGNNKTSGTISYIYNGVSQTVAVQTFDLYVNGTRIGNDLVGGALPANADITSGTFIGVSSTNNVANIFVDDAVVHNSVPPAIGTVTLTTALAGTGSGQVTSNPPGISCGADCTETYTATDNTVVQLTAVASVGSTFAGWSGDCAGQGAVCQVTMSQARSATATFTLNQYQLSVTRAGTSLGSVTSSPPGIDCGATCSASFDEGAQVTLTAPDLSPDYRFVGWSGDCTGTGQCQVSMTQARAVTATFIHMHALGVQKNGTGSGTVTSSPGGIDCGPTCSANFDEGIQVTLTAVPDASAAFLGWSGACTNTSGPCVVTMSSATSVTARFDVYETTIDTYPPDPDNQTSVTFTFSSSPAGLTFECKLDSEAFAQCTSPAQRSNVTEGTHTFYVRACEAASNCDPTPASHTWTIDLTPPDTTITSGPADGSTSGPSVTFTFDSTEPGVTFQCKLDEDPFVTCTSPRDYAGLVDGSMHTFSVRACDSVGNCDSTFATRSWTVDAMGPTVSIVSTTPNPTNGGSTVTFSADEAGTFEIRVSGSDCSSGNLVLSGAYGPAGTDHQSPIFQAQMTEGSNPIYVCLRDAAGNTGSATTTIVLDTMAPTVSILSTNPNPTTSGTTLTWHADEPGTFEVRVGGTDCSSGHVGHTGDYITASNPVDTVILPSELLRGSNTIRVCVRDAAGNTGSATTTVQMQSCVAPDNGSGTASDLPAECRLLGGPMPLITPPPPGEPVMMVSSIDNPRDTSSVPGGSLLGQRTTSTTNVRLAFRPTSAAVVGTPIPRFDFEVLLTMDSAPRTPGAPVQTFDTEMFAMSGQLPPGDPDFDLLRIRGGSSFGMPSPGHTTLTRVPGTNNFSVDSFFDVFYTIDYAGRAGGPFSGMSGSTTGTIRMSSLGGPTIYTVCYSVDGLSLPDCPMEGWPVTISNGLPTGVSMTSDVTFSNPRSVSSSSGGTLGGTRHTFVRDVTLHMAGTGDPDFDLLRVIPINDCPSIIDEAPHSPASSTQSFDTEMFSLQCQITGDPDFDLLRITGGSGQGKPSPGKARMTQRPDGSWAVDSFFDVFYEIDFTGKPGGRFHGMSGSTTGTIRMRQGTPPPSITVLKLNDTTGDPLPGWDMNLYGGPGCTGPVLDTQTTNADGLADFILMSTGDYSVSEVMQGGWTPITPVCQDMSVDGSSGGSAPRGGGGGGGGGCGGGTCGAYTWASGVHMSVELQGMPPVHITGNGDTIVQRSSTCPGCGPGGSSYFDTEMLSMDLTSSQCPPFCIRESPTRHSLGRVTQQTPSGPFYPADSFFDVFYEIQTPIGPLHTDLPVNQIDLSVFGFDPVPITAALYRSPTSTSLPLLNAGGQPVGMLHRPIFVPMPPGEKLIVFRNQPPAPTATNTATDTPTDTPTETATATATATPTNTPPDCIVPDNGSGTIDLPPAPCRYFGGPMSITTGLPAGSSLDSAGSIDTFTNVVRTPGGSLGGEQVEMRSSTHLVMTGSGAFSTFRRTFNLVDTFPQRWATAPRTPGQPVQSFDTEMIAMQLQLPPGDPDFDLLRITAGSSFGMPSPGHTTLTQLPGGNWAVDSFFDITYRIDFVGRPGGALGGMSGSTTGTIRMSAHNGPRPPTQCSVADNGTGSADFPAQCPYAGWPMSMIDGMPQGTMVVMDSFFDVFTNVTTTPGGSLGGTKKGYDYYQAQSALQSTGAQTNPYRRFIEFTPASMEVDLAPYTPGQPVQSFDTAIISMVAQLPPGDPDFDLLRITAGSSFGLPSPGHTTLTQLPGGQWNVDSFFDITYRIEFVGRAGGPFGGMSGSTTGTIRMQQGTPSSGGASPTPTYTPTPIVDYCVELIVAGQVTNCQTGSDATTSDNTVTRLSIPMNAGVSGTTARITETNNPSPPLGFSSCGQLVHIDVGGITLSSPATITFEIDVSHCGEASPTIMQLFRDGSPLPDCDGTASNEPCVCGRSRESDGDLLMCGKTTHFSDWFAAFNDSSISGTVTYGNPVTGTNPRGVPNVLLSGAGSPAVSDTTAAAGTYLLNGFGVGSYTITPSKSGGINGAITSNDSARIAQYITGNTSLTTAQQTVADVSGFGGLSSFDAALIARYVVSLPPPTGNTGTWIFSPTSNTHLTVTADITGEDYTGLLMGDVSGNWGDPSPFRPVIGGNGPERNAAVKAPALVTPADNEVVIPVAVQSLANKGVISYEFDLRYDPLVIQPQENPVDVAETVSSGLSVVVNAETPGLLRVVAYGPMPIDANGLLLNLRFTAVGTPGSVSPLTWERFMLNEGTPRITAADGQVELVRALPNQAEINGRLLTSFGEGVPNSRVTLTDTTGRSRSILSNGFGIFRFGNLQVGQTFTIQVNARDHTFAPATVSVTGQIVNVDMIAEQ